MPILKQYTHISRSTIHLHALGVSKKRAMYTHYQCIKIIESNRGRTDKTSAYLLAKKWEQKIEENLYFEGNLFCVVFMSELSKCKITKISNY